jgi:hypothetical protein
VIRGGVIHAGFNFLNAPFFVEIGGHSLPVGGECLLKSVNGFEIVGGHGVLLGFFRFPSDRFD